MPISPEELAKRLAAKREQNLSGSVGSKSVAEGARVNAPEAQRPAQKTVQKPQPRAPAPAGRPPREQDALPEAPEMEKAVLGAIFANAKTGFSAFERSGRKGFFANPVHRELYVLGRQFYEEKGALDLIGFTLYLDQLGKLKSLGASNVTELFAPTAPLEEFDYYLNQLRDIYLRRKIMSTSFLQAKRAKNEDPRVLLEEMANMVEGLKVTAAGGPNGAINYDLDDLLAFDISNDPDCLVGRRFLVRGGSWLIAGPTGCGKSSLLVQLAIYWATGTPIFGMRARRPLKTLIFQAEDDFGDVSEEVQGIFTGIQASEDLDLEKFNTVIRQNLTLKRVRGLSGEQFLRCLEEYVRIHKPDLVGINPLLAYAGCDLCKPAEIGPFLRDQLFVLGEKYHYCTVVMHHTPKPLRDGSDSKDLLYLGFGSSEVQNSFRATSTITQAAGAPGIWRFDMGKRLLRSGAKTPAGEMTDVVYLEYSKTGICWLQVENPETESGSMEDILLQMDFEKPIKTATIQRTMYEEFEMPRRTFFRHWRKLKTDGEIKEITGKNGKGWIAVGDKGAKASAANSATF